MGGYEVRTAQKDRYAAIIDQDDVTEEVRNIALKYDPVNRAGYEGFHVTENGELHIDDEKVIDTESSRIGSRGSTATYSQWRSPLTRSPSHRPQSDSGPYRWPAVD